MNKFYTGSWKILQKVIGILAEDKGLQAATSNLLRNNNGTAERDQKEERNTKTAEFRSVAAKVEKYYLLDVKKNCNTLVYAESIR